MQNKKVVILGKEIIRSPHYEKLGFVVRSENLIIFVMYEISTIRKKVGKFYEMPPNIVENFREK